MHIGIFGGTFDPPHVGHLIAASDAAEHLGLDRVVLIPTSAQPLKTEGPRAKAQDRLAMVRLLAARDPRLEVESMEIDRGGLSFTIDTLRALRQRWPAGKADLTLLLGADAAAQFTHWKDPEGIRGLAKLAVLTRDDESAPEGMQKVATRRVDISSSEIRTRVREGKPIEALVTESVAEYIAAHGLYR